jgi:phospholipid-binding lipoprotein MlaA
MHNTGKLLPLGLGILLLAGCASNGDPRDPRDPLEPVNRAVHSFNEAVDDAALKPLAKGYRAIAPRPVQIGVSNFFSNLDDVTVFGNSLLQFKLEQAASDFLRVAFNTAFGLFGLLDVATEMGLKKHNEDFGQTLGRWGIPSGPYLVLPVLGASSFRDTAGLVADSHYSDPVSWVESIPDRNAVLVVRGISRRADLLEAKRALDEASLDGYEFSRDFYLERREALVYDGRPPLAE